MPLSKSWLQPGFALKQVPFPVTSLQLRPVTLKCNKRILALVPAQSQSTIILYLLDAMYFSKHLTFNLHSNLKIGFVIIPIKAKETKEQARLSNLAKVTQLIHDGARIQTRANRILARNSVTHSLLV